MLQWRRWVSEPSDTDRDAAAAASESLASSYSLNPKLKPKPFAALAVASMTGPGGENPKTSPVPPVAEEHAEVLAAPPVDLSSPVADDDGAPSAEGATADAGGGTRLAHLTLTRFTGAAAAGADEEAASLTVLAEASTAWPAGGCASLSAASCAASRASASASTPGRCLARASRNSPCIRGALPGLAPEMAPGSSRQSSRTPGTFTGDTKLLVTAIESERFSTWCHHPHATKRTSPACCTPAMGPAVAAEAGMGGCAAAQDVESALEETSPALLLFDCAPRPFPRAACRAARACHSSCTSACLSKWSRYHSITETAGRSGVERDRQGKTAGLGRAGQRYGDWRERG